MLELDELTTDQIPFHPTKSDTYIKNTNPTESESQIKLLLDELIKEINSDSPAFQIRTMLIFGFVMFIVGVEGFTIDFVFMSPSFRCASSNGGSST